LEILTTADSEGGRCLGGATGQLTVTIKKCVKKSKEKKMGLYERDGNGGENGGEKGKALDSAISQLEKKYGKGAIMSLGNSIADKVESFSSGSLTLDIALGIGGFPKGRICEIYGPESSGKTTLALSATAEVQRAGGTVVYIDAEHALDVNYAKRLGVDTSKLLVSQPDCGEQALEICEALVSSNSVDLVVVDSVAALVPRAEIDGEMEDQQPGLQARLMSKALRKLTAITAKSNTTIIFINQIRMKIGVMFGSPETTTGGNALKFYASVRLDVRRIGSIKDQNDVTGNRVRVKVVKNKVAAPFREAEFDIIFNEGVSLMGEIVDLGCEKGIVDKSGAWFSFRGERMGQGREGAKQFLRDNPEIAKTVRALIMDSYKVDAANAVQSADDSEEATGPELSLVEKSPKGKKRAAANE
jgi:recombination protein RecA